MIFNGTTRLITLEVGDNLVNVEDMYSRWKDWVLSDNAGFWPAFRTFGGDPTAAGQFAPKFFFLTNGWRVFVDGTILPYVEAGINLYVEGGGDPFVKVNDATVSNKVSDIPVIENNTGSGLDVTQSAMLLAMYQAHFHKRDVQGNVVKIYDSTGTTQLYEFDTDSLFSVMDPKFTPITP